MKIPVLLPIFPGSHTGYLFEYPEKIIRIGKAALAGYDRRAEI
jgi:hypothetical protein